MAETSLKQRIIGAAVLISLVVIFVPMLFTGKHDGFKPDAAGEIPQPPDKLKTIIYRLDDDGEFRELGKPPSPEATVETVLQKSEPTEIEVPPAEEQVVKSTPKLPQTPTQVPPGSWLVQLASFGQQDNAIELRDSIRDKGDSAFVDKRTVDGKDIWRVRIGPYAKKDEANRALARLEKSNNLKGLVIYRE